MTSSLVLKISLGAIIASLLRWGFQSASNPAVGLLIANTIGCFIIGFATKSQWSSQSWLTVGFCGALTSFSALCFHVATAINEANYLTGLYETFITIIFCSIAFLLSRRVRWRTL
tara:strand:+ start:11495 stop:11839 length:345 start_codon:yes stop_codon:yes gene_type:complete